MKDVRKAIQISGEDILESWLCKHETGACCFFEGQDCRCD